LTAASVDELFTLARDAEDDGAYWECVTTLHGRPEQRTFELAQVLCDSLSPGDRTLGADVLGQLGGQFTAASARVLRELLESEDEPSVLAAAAIGIGHLRDGQAIDRLRALAPHHDVQVRLGVVHGLMGHDDDRAVSTLTALSEDGEDSVRDWATFALGVQTERDTPELREVLAARLEDPSPAVRAEALRGLALRGDQRALEPALVAAAEMRSPAVDEAVVLLGALTGDARLAPHLQRLRDDPEASAEHGQLLDQALRRCEGAGAA
jgi:HEAT repeat protein